MNNLDKQKKTTQKVLVQEEEEEEGEKEGERCANVNIEQEQVIVLKSTNYKASKGKQTSNKDLFFLHIERLACKPTVSVAI